MMAEKDDPGRGKTLHLQFNETILEYLLYEEKFINVLAQKVIRNTQLKHLTDQLMLSLLKHDHHDVFSGKVNDLVNCPDFIQACSDTYFAPTGNRGYYLLHFIDMYRDGNSAHERMKDLRDDPFLQYVLEQTECLPITRGVLSALLGFWSDDALYNKVGSAIGQHIAIHGHLSRVPHLI